VLRAARQADSRLKRGRVLAALEELKAGGEPITFPAVRQAAGVSKWLVYAPGVREHIEAAIAGQAKKTRRASAAGGTGGGAAGITASAASLACDLELARDQLRQLRAERDKLKAADLHPGVDLDLPDVERYPFYGKNGYYRSWEASSLAPERKEAVEREAASSGTRPSAIAYVMQHPKAIKTALLADAATRSAAREALAEFDAPPGRRRRRGPRPSR
jgi:hypothetical protein